MKKWLCEKWFRGHKCAATVQLHAIHELWELLQGYSPLDSGSDEEESDIQVNMLLSQEVAAVDLPQGSSLSYPFFISKSSTHRMHDLGSIVSHIWSKVFTDIQMS
jgi:hypothetical protein